MLRVKPLLDFIDDRIIVERGVLLFTLWMAYEAFEWAKWYADHTAKDGLQVAAIIGAVTAPASALLNFIFKTMGESSKPPAPPP